METRSELEIESKQRLKIHVGSCTKHLNAVESGESYSQREGAMICKLAWVPLGLCFNLTAVVIARGLLNKEERFPMGAMLLSR